MSNITFKARVNRRLRQRVMLKAWANYRQRINFITCQESTGRDMSHMKLTFREAFSIALKKAWDALRTAQEKQARRIASYGRADARRLQNRETAYKRSNKFHATGVRLTA